MAEQWISAAKALEIAESRFALCTRLNAGLIYARAKKFLWLDRSDDEVLIPKEFWWAGGHNDLEQDWASGDFATTISDKGRLQAIGVTIDLTGLLEMVEIERRVIMARSLSVAGSNDWITAREARNISYSQCGYNPASSGDPIIEMARLGFIAGRAILAQRSSERSNPHDWAWEEREWDIPPWFWDEFTFTGRSAQDWETGRFSGKGHSPHGLVSMTLSGVHFYRPSLAALSPNQAGADAPTKSAKGRTPEYKWDDATTAIWGEIYRAELIPDNQAQVEKAFQRVLRKGDKEKSESGVRPYARAVWDEFSR